MRTLLLIALFLSPPLKGEETIHLRGKAAYEILFMSNEVIGRSEEVTGAINCIQENCRFHLSIPIKSFDSNIGRRDRHMRQALEAKKYPTITASGKFAEYFIPQESYRVRAQVTFHGVKRSYDVEVDDFGKTATLTIDLEAHKVKRPSLFGIKVHNKVPVKIYLKWS